MSKLKTLIHRILRAIRSLIQAFRTEGPRGRSGGQTARPNPWPRCIACHRRVPELCGECGVCTACCDPENHEKEQDPTE